MRIPLAFSLLAAAVGAISLANTAPSQAQEYPWCAQYSGRGGSNCGFVSYRQCMAAVSGTGGNCSRNQFTLDFDDHRVVRPAYRVVYPYGYRYGY